MSAIAHGRRHVAKGAAWRLVEVMGADVFAFGTFIISARLLLPTEVGIVAEATLLIMTVQLILYQELGEALIQSDETGSAHFSSAFWLNLAIGATACLILITTADLDGHLLGEPDLPPVLQALAPTLLLFAASSIYQAKLRRDLLLRCVTKRLVLSASMFTHDSIQQIGLPVLSRLVHDRARIYWRSPGRFVWSDFSACRFRSISPWSPIS